MQARVLLNGRSTACPITRPNHLPQVPDSATPAGASLGCPETEDFGRMPACHSDGYRDLLLHIHNRGASLDQQRPECVAQVVETDLADSSLRQYRKEVAVIQVVGVENTTV